MASSPTDAAIAVTRLGLGARPGEIDRIVADPRGWLLDQIRPDGAPQPDAALVPSEQRLAELTDYRRDRRQTRRDAPPMNAENDAEATRRARQTARRGIAEDTAQAFLARARLGATTDRGFAERWALFWANAITVSSTKFDAGAERE